MIRRGQCSRPRFGVGETSEFARPKTRLSTRRDCSKKEVHLEHIRTVTLLSQNQIEYEYKNETLTRHIITYRKYNHSVTMVENKMYTEEKQQQPVVQSSSSESSSSSDESHSPNEKTIASGATGAIVGFLFGGPILSALLGFGAAYVSQKTGAPGDAARALGDIGLSVRNKAKEVDDKHHIVEKSSKVATDVWEGAKQYDQKHNILEKTKDFTVASWESFVKFVQDRRILQKGVDGVGQGYEFVAEKLSCGLTTSTDCPPVSTTTEK